MKILVTVVPLSLLIAGCMQAAPPTDPSVITSRSDAWEAALNAGDVDTLLGMYTSDARVLAPNRKMASGSAAVRAVWVAVLEDGPEGGLLQVSGEAPGAPIPPGSFPPARPASTPLSGDIGYASLPTQHPEGPHEHWLIH